MIWPRRETGVKRRDARRARPTACRSGAVAAPGTVRRAREDRAEGRASARRVARVILSGPRAIPPGVCAESPCDAPPRRCIVPEPSGAGTPRGAPRGTPPARGRAPGSVTSRRLPLVRGPQSALPIATPSSRTPSIDGREAGLARRPRRAAGLAVARQLRDLAARHAPRRGRRPALPHRRPQRLREGLARDPLPLADHPDAGPRRRLQRPGRVRRPEGHRGPGPGRDVASRSRCALEPTRVGAPEGAAAGATNLNPRYTFSNFIVGSANRLAHAARCRSRSARATPTTRCSCTAASASARPT